ncbi:hypothetical protein DB88DRAFT_479083 [Papiliotrema laurentii]|uniref:Uncharacterized protein n=1 Tax=Papiliotrema laurentii TaxID=5418 RepID=A0AAD9L915_PAPLA|nr:hypothetical protein DB88DRAFT_479083 [Papiliotrema laurentii]
MPFLSSIGHRRSASQSESSDASYLPTSPRSPRGSTRVVHPHHPPHRDSTTSVLSDSSSAAPSSILKRPTVDSSETSSTTSSAYITKRFSNALGFDRTETFSSLPESDDEENPAPSTPATSVSSFGNQCPLPASGPAQKFPFFTMTLSSTSTLSFIALPLALRPIVLDAVQRAWKRGVSKTGQVDYAPELMKKHKEKGCEGGVWEVTLKGDCWIPSSSDKVSSKRILVYLMTEFAREGYSLSSSYRMSKKDTGKDTLIFLKGEPDPDPVFFSVAFHSNDRVWIIDSPADVGEALEEGIKAAWVEGIQAARTRERHCREIRLRGNPWTAHSTSALISARCIQLVIMKSITHASQGYDFVGSVDMSDLEEGELPTTFYRAKWGPTRAIWGEQN